VTSESYLFFYIRDCPARVPINEGPSKRPFVSGMLNKLNDALRIPLEAKFEALVA
jgi:hypothetical protein